MESARQSLRGTHTAKCDSAFHSEVSSNAEYTKQHREEEGENNLTPCDDSVDAKEKRADRFAGGALTECSAQALAPEKLVPWSQRSIRSFLRD